MVGGDDMLRDAMAIPLDPFRGQGRLYTSTYPCARTPPSADARYPHVRQQSELNRGDEVEEDL